MERNPLCLCFGSWLQQGSGKPCPRVFHTGMTPSKKSCPGQCHLLLCTAHRHLWCGSCSAGTSACDTDRILCNSWDATGGWSRLTVIPTIRIYPPSDLSDQPSKKDTRLALAKEQLLWEAVGTGGAAFPLELLSVPLGAHSGATEGPEHQPSMVLSRCSPGVSCTLLQQQGHSARSSVKNSCCFVCLQERINN